MDEVTEMKKQLLKEAKLAEITKRNLAKVNSIIYPSDIDESHSEDNGYIIIRNLNKIYDNDVQAVFDFNLNISKNEFIVLVGPSGCGKSTTLRMICGLEEISSGELFINRVYSNELPPKDRDIAMVFQSYALYPHMSVFDNIAFGLKIKKVPVPVMDKDGNPVLGIDRRQIKELRKKGKNLLLVIKESTHDILGYDKEADKLNKLKAFAGEKELAQITDRLFVLQEKREYDESRIVRANNEIVLINKKIEELKNSPTQKYVLKHLKKEEIEQKVEEVAKILEITKYLNRKPKALSGGQRQRVALGRAIVRNAAAFLMDEPLSNLDAKLRVQMRAEIVSLHRQIGATTIYVTHDQTEAMTMADRIVVMNEGVVQQIGSPRTIYEHPANLFVATFIGAPSMNIIDANVDNNKIKFPSGVTIDLSKEQVNEAKEFYESEIVRLKDTVARLDNAMRDVEDKRMDVYVLAKEKTLALIQNYEEKLNGKFNVLFGIRPEDVYICDKDEKDYIELKAEVVELLGSEYYVYSKINGQKIVLKIPSNLHINLNDVIHVKFNMERAHIFDDFSQRTLF